MPRDIVTLNCCVEYLLGFAMALACLHRAAASTGMPKQMQMQQNMPSMLPKDAVAHSTRGEKAWHIESGMIVQSGSPHLVSRYTNSGSHAWTEPNVKAANTRASDGLSSKERTDSREGMDCGGLILNSCSGVEGWCTLKMENALSEVSTAKWAGLCGCQDTCTYKHHVHLISEITYLMGSYAHLQTLHG